MGNIAAFQYKLNRLSAMDRNLRRLKRKPLRGDLDMTRTDRHG